MNWLDLKGDLEQARRENFVDLINFSLEQQFVLRVSNSIDARLVEAKAHNEEMIWEMQNEIKGGLA